MSIRIRPVLHRLGVCAFLAAAGSACAHTVFAEPEPLDFEPPPDRSWQLARSTPVGSATIYEYVPAGDDLESWDELMTMARIYRMIGESKRDMFEDLQEIHEERCPGSTRWNVVEEVDDHFIFESWTGPCMDSPDQYELVLLVDGTRDRIRLTYTVKAEDVDPEVREAWLASMRAARLVKEGS